MLKNSSDYFSSQAELTTQPSPQSFPNPEPSDEPTFRPPKRSDTEKTSKAQEPHMSSELNSSLLQVSTQQSLNFKHSFSLTSPKLSVPATPFLLGNKLKELQGQSLSLRLSEKLKELENDLKTGNTQENYKENLPVDEEFKSENRHVFALENRVSLESEEDCEIPSLRWCAACKAEVQTQIEYVNSRKTFWASVGIFLSGGVLGCFLLPYMSNSCKGAKVVCHKCRRVLA